MTREQDAVGTAHMVGPMLRLLILAPIALFVDFAYLATGNAESVADVVASYSVLGMTVLVPHTPGTLLFSAVIVATVFWMTLSTARGHAVE